MIMHKAPNAAASVAAAIAILLATPALAQQNYDIRIDNRGVTAKPVEQQLPNYPGRGVRSGQEGWVRINFIVTPEGTTIDPVIVDSSGGGGFEHAALAAVADWRFEAAETQHANNTADIRFELNRGRDAATSNFMRRYRRVVTHIVNNETEAARSQVDSAAKLGGWNLYESTMLWLMIGRVDGAEGNNSDKLEKYRRALGVSGQNALESEDRAELLGRLFELEIEHAQYASAQRTFAQLRNEPAGRRETEIARKKAANLHQILATGDPLAANATIYNPCDCATGTPLWSYVPARRTFSFSNLSGNVERFEVRCENERLEHRIETDRTWSLPTDAGNCRVFVFGDDGASFDFVEHSGIEPDEKAHASAVAREHDLDRPD